MKTVVGQGKGRRVLRKVSARLPSSSEGFRLPIALLALISCLFLLFADGDSLLRGWPLCVLIGAMLQVFGDFLLHRGRWFAGDLSRIAGFLCVNLGMLLFIAWAWAGGEDAWFWYATLVYGTFAILLLGWHSNRPPGDGPRVR